MYNWFLLILMIKTNHRHRLPFKKKIIHCGLSQEEEDLDEIRRTALVKLLIVNTTTTATAKDLPNSFFGDLAP